MPTRVHHGGNGHTLLPIHFVVNPCFYKHWFDWSLVLLRRKIDSPFTYLETYKSGGDRIRWDHHQYRHARRWRRGTARGEWEERRWYQRAWWSWRRCRCSGGQPDAAGQYGGLPGLEVHAVEIPNATDMPPHMDSAERFHGEVRGPKNVAFDDG